MEITMKEKSSREVRVLETTSNGYKVVVNITTESGRVISLNGSITPSKTTEEYVGGVGFSAYKRDGAWYTDLNGASNAEHATVSALAVAAVNYAVGKYETAA